MTTISAVSVFCGSRLGDPPAYRAAAEELGSLLARRGIRLVYGGGGIGLMGILADAALAGGGLVTGVIPEFLVEHEVEKSDVTDLVVVDSMHARKTRMFELTDGCIVLPGGLGTLDEAIEVITWKQLRLHDKPVVVVNTDGFWEPFLALVEAVIGGGFAHPDVRGLFTVVDRVDQALPALEAAPEANPEVLTSHL
ncbi:MAG: TIGR00730 family Rossman fold protein [Rhodospirillales bacterium]|nr:TIGR00730 family Rossman fold protein [Rhodospirillales bacterium]